MATSSFRAISHIRSLVGDLSSSQLFSAVGSGVLLSLAFPPMNLSFVAWASLVPLLSAFEKTSPRKMLMLGWITGFVHSVSLFYWTTVAMNCYGKIPMAISIVLLVLLAFYLGSYVGLFGWFLGLAKAQTARFSLFLMAPFFWVFLEYARSCLFTGFPWALLGHSQYQNLTLIQICDITGVAGVSFLVVLVNVFLFFLLRWLVYLFKKRRETDSVRFPLLEGAVTVSVIALVSGYGLVRLDTIRSLMGESPVLDVALVQGNIDQAQKWDRTNFQRTVRTYETLTEKAAQNHIDLVVWPETAVPGYYVPELQDSTVVRAIADRTDTAILFGSLAYDCEQTGYQTFNSAFAVFPHEETLFRYDKSHLVPFGEYVPLKPLLPFVDKLVEGIGEFSPGKKYPVFPISGARCGVLICYEIIFPQYACAYAKQGATVLVNITNDAWFGRTGATYQHLSTAVFRAVETRLPVIRAANTGVSAIIDQTGKINKQTPVFIETLLTGTIPIFRERTFFVCYRERFMLLYGVVLLFIFFKTYFFQKKDDT